MKRSKALRFFLAFTLFFTQGDFQLAFAFSGAVPQPVLTKADASASFISSVRGILTQLQASLSKDTAPAKGAPGQIKITVPSGDYYVIDPAQARILEMGVAESRYSVDYLFDESHNELIRIRTLPETPESLESYELYRPGEGLLESGLIAQGISIPLRKYDRTQGTVTLYDPQNPYAEAVYILKTSDSNEPFRLIHYRSEVEGEAVAFDVHYDDLRHTQTVLNSREKSYETYELIGESGTGRLLEIGQIECGENGIQLKERQLVELFNLQRQGESLPTYVFTREEDPNYLAVFERLPQGGLGRLLWFRGKDESGNPIDQEFYYERDEATGEETLVMLDHVKASFLRFILNEGPASPGVLDPVGERDGANSGLLGVVSGSKKMGAGNAIHLSRPEAQRDLRISREIRPREIEKWEPWVRGPPEANASVSASSNSSLSSPVRPGVLLRAETLLSEFNSNLLLQSLALCLRAKGCFLSGLLKANKKSTQSKGGF